MIEDLQDELQEEKPRRRKSKGIGRGTFLAIALLCWFVFAAVVGIICMPNAIVAIRDSGVREYIGKAIGRSGQTSTNKALVCYVLPSSNGDVVYRLFEQDVPKTGATSYHDAVEGLLKGPGHDALTSGAITFITDGTQLRGLTVSEGVAFVDFSGEFASSGSNWGPEGLDAAEKQVEYTLKAIDPSIKRIVVMVDGSVLDR